MTEEYFKDRVAVITGAGGVICSAIARDLASLGCVCILVGRTEDTLLAVREEICAAGGRAEVYPCDVTDREAVFKMAEEVMATHKRCDFLINGAGGNDARCQPKITEFDERELDPDCPSELLGLYRVDMDAFEAVLRLNTMGTFYPTLAFARYMAKREGGSIINFASMNTYCPLTRNFAYAMAKAAISNLTESLAAYFAKAGIRINAIAPGFILNPRSRRILGSVEEGLTKRGADVIAHTPMGRFGEATEMCGTVRWLLDGRASAFVTGVTVPVDGGFLTLSGV